MAFSRPPVTTYLRLADLTVCVEHRYGVIPVYCKDYIVPPSTPDITVALSEQDCLASTTGVSPDASPDYIEFISLCRHLSTAMAKRNVCLFHAAVIEVDGRGIGFFAPSGTGKSTHIGFWKKRYGDRVRIVNGDKPFLKQKDGIIYAYGSPFCGKERWQRNVAVPLHALCHLTRGETDSITALSPADATSLLLGQLYLPPDATAALNVMGMTDTLVSSVALYTVACTPTVHAAETVHNAIFFDEILKLKEGQLS